MFDTVDVTVLDDRGTLAAVADAAAVAQAAEARILDLACRWADLNAFVADQSTLPGTERLVTLGGDTTPPVAEFAPAELAAVLAMSPFSAAKLIGDALDLRHRLPVLWARVQAGEVKGWVARRIAQTTHQLPAAITLQIDPVIARYADRKTAAELEAICTAEAIRLDPHTARLLADTVRGTHGVWVAPSAQTGTGAEVGTKEMLIRADAADVIRLDAALDRTADDLALLGDHSTHDHRRAKAVGVIARPQLALDYRTQAQTIATGSEPTPRSGRGGVFPTATLYVHLTDQTLRDGDGVARVEQIGPVLASQARDWLSHDHVVVKPVIDLNRQAPVDSYEIPDRLREAVHLTTPTDTFPYATNKTRHQDIDHTIAFDDTGPPGQTRIGNLAPMTRFHHRIKTHGGWQLRQPFPGILIWQTPHGRHFLVDHTGTRAIPTPA